MTIVSLLFHDVYAADPRESGFRSPAADRYKLSIPEFEAQLDGLAQASTADLATAVRGCATRDPSDPGPVMITFDDGGVSYYTAVADRLERSGGAATASSRPISSASADS